MYRNRRADEKTDCCTKFEYTWGFFLSVIFFASAFRCFVAFRRSVINSKQTDTVWIGQTDSELGQKLAEHLGPEYGDHWHDFEGQELAVYPTD